MARLKLRPYQKEAVLSLMEVAKRAHRRGAGVRTQGGGSEPLPAEKVLCCQPTGAGKTEEILALAHLTGERWGWRTLIIVPSSELVRQTAERARSLLAGGKKIGIIVGGKCRIEGYDLVVSTSASLHSRRLTVIPRDLFQLVVVDEAHHAASRSFNQILSHFSGCRLLVGMTATYVRGDGVSVAAPKYFSSVVVYHTIGQLTTAGYLAPAEGFYRHTGLVLENVPVRRGNLDEEKLAHAVNTPERNRMAVEAWFDHARGRPTVVFCVNIDHAQAMAECFRRHGVPAAAVWGAMDDAGYRAVMRDYRGGRVKVLANARLLIEGFDAPLTSAVIIARPATPSAAAVLGPQMIGRALRLHPESGKEDAVIIELMDEKILPCSREAASEKIRSAVERVSRSLLADAYGLDERDVGRGHGMLHEKARRARTEGAWRERRKLFEDLKSVEAVKERFNVIERIALVSQYAWVPLGAGTYHMALAGGDFIEVVEETPSYYEVRVVERKELKFVGSSRTRDEAIRVADCWLARNGIDHYYMHRNEPWREKPASRAQIHTAHKLTGLSKEFLATLRSGQISDLITSAKALMVPAGPLLIIESDSSGADAGVKEPERAAARAAQKSSHRLHTWQFQLNFT